MQYNYKLHFTISAVKELNKKLNKIQTFDFNLKPTEAEQRRVK